MWNIGDECINVDLGRSRTKLSGRRGGESIGVKLDISLRRPGESIMPLWN